MLFSTLFFQARKSACIFQSAV